MKTMSQELKDHFASENKTICLILEIKTKSNDFFRYTSHFKDVIYNGNLFLSYAGFKESNIDSSSGSEIDNLEIELPLIGSKGLNLDQNYLNNISQDKIISGHIDGASISLMAINYKDISMGHVVLKKGVIGNISVLRDSVKLEIRGISQLLNQKIVRIFSPTCYNNFGDSKCTIDKNNHTFFSTVSGVISNSVFSSDINIIDYSNEARIGNISAIDLTDGTHIYLQCIGNNLLNNDSVWFSGINGDLSGLNSIGMRIERISSQTIRIPINGLKFTYPIENSQYRLCSSFNYDSYLTNYLHYIPGPDIWAPLSQYIGRGFISTTGSVKSSLYQGQLTFLTGNNAGTTIEIKDYIYNQFTMQDNFIYPIQVGDRFKVVRGCDKTLNNCIRYNNSNNYRGFPVIPGQDKLVSGMMKN